MDPTDAMDDDSALQAGFDSTSDDDTIQSAKGSMDAGAGDGDKQPKDEPSTAAAPQGSKAEGQSEQPAADPYADLPPQVRDLLAVAARVPDLERNLAAVTEHSRRFEGQVRSLQSRLDKQTAAAGKTPQAIERIDRARQAYEGDLPELADALEELKGLLPQPLEPDDPAPQPVATQPTATSTKAPSQPAQAGIDPVAQAHMEALDQVAPTWFDDLNGTDAQLWLTTRPDMAAEFKQMRTASQVLKVHGEFNKYRQAQQQAQTLAATTTARRAAAATPQGVSRKPPPQAVQSEEDAMKAGFFT